MYKHGYNSLGKETIVTLDLPDTGSELVAIGGYELFQNIPLVDAPHPILLVTAGKSRLKGGDRGGKVIVSVPAYTKNEKLQIFKCIDVFVYVAANGPRRILGLPFMVLYGLAFVPGYDPYV